MSFSKKIDFFEEWLNEMCEKKEDYYYINQEIFKSFLFKGQLEKYMKKMEPYCVKHDYICEPYTYKRCMTLFRQICRKNGNCFEYKIRYIKSQYFIDYYFYL